MKPAYRIFVFMMFCALAWIGLTCASMMAAVPLMGQGVTTSAINGVVKDAQGAVIPGVSITAVHQPSGTTYTGLTQEDGRYIVQGMRVGGPYTVNAALPGFATDVQKNVSLSLGVTEDINFVLKVAAASESIDVIAESDPVFTSTRTGAGMALTREDLGTLPTISGRITDVTRVSPQAGGQGTFAGQDNRMNNITIDGASFNGAFGLDTTTGGPGDRTNVAPVSLEVIDQVQVNVAPYDVRQGHFTGANVNSVTRTGGNTFTGSFYTRYRNQSYVGTNAAGQAFNPGTFTTKDTGFWAGGPIIRNKLFFFGGFEKQEDTRPLVTFTSNPGGAPVTGNTSRVLNSDLQGLRDYLTKNFSYDPGPFDNIPKLTPAKPWMVKGNYNISSNQTVSFRYNQLSSNTNVLQSGSSSLGTSRQVNTANFLNFANSNYQIEENIKSGVGEWNAVWGTFTNQLIVSQTYNDESRVQLAKLFPFVVIGDGAGSPLTSFGSEPFTPFNLLTYKQFLAQDSVTKIMKNHLVTFGGGVEKFHSDNSFYFGVQSAYSYNTLADFYTDANGYLANQNRTTSPITLSIFQVKNLLITGPGGLPPLQPLDVWTYNGYLQDQWRPLSNVTVSAGLRVDVPRFGNTGFNNPAANALSFRDQNGSGVNYNSGALPATTAYWSPRVGLNWSPTKSANTQVRGGTGLFTGTPPYVWISNQIANTGVLFGFIQSNNTTAFPFSPNPDKYKPAPAGGSASSYELDVTDHSYRFPQIWRNNLGADYRLPWGLVATTDFIYNRDLNAPVYINANLPAPESAYTGVDARPRWVATTAFPACAAAGQAGPCVTRLNNATGNQVTAAYIIKNSSQNNSWNWSASLAKQVSHGFMFRTGYNYSVSKSLVEPSSTAGSSWGSANPIVTDPNNPPLANSQNSPGSRYFLQVNYSRRYFGWGATTVSVFSELKHNVPVGFFGPNYSYVFSGDANGDTVSGNDLIYIPRDQTEMNFKSLTVSGNTYTPAQQAAAFDQFINNDPYLSQHRGHYAERNAAFFPFVNRFDASISQDVFHGGEGNRHTGQIRLDITNFGNLMNHNWGVGQRVINNQILTSPSVDANGGLTYNLQTLNGQLLTTPFTSSAGTSDVYTLMLSFRYMFN
jgi:Carboxypeptidase regulatory-like domain